MSDILKIKDKATGLWQTIIAIKGDQGDDYVITQSDYQAIANIVLNDIDATQTSY